MAWLTAPDLSDATRSSSREVRISWYQLFFLVYFSRGTLPTNMPIGNPFNQKRGERSGTWLGDLG